MKSGSVDNLTPDLLRAFLLGSLDFDAAFHLQSALADQIAGQSTSAALVLCEHPPLITVGRDGSLDQIQAESEELAARRWPVRWVSRGGSTVLHLPGQLAVYPVLPLHRLNLDVGSYLARLHAVLVAVLDDFGIRAETRIDRPGVWVGNRLIAAVGITVRDWISGQGAWLNIDPDLTLYRLVRSGSAEEGPMTSLARERRGPLRPALVRQRVLEHFAGQFGFGETDLRFHPPGQLGHRRLTAPTT